jgi:hypothetical protein
MSQALKVVFWNTMKLRDVSTLCRLARVFMPDFLIIAEPAIEPPALVELLKKVDSGYCHKESVGEELLLFSRYRNHMVHCVRSWVRPISSGANRGHLCPRQRHQQVSPQHQDILLATVVIALPRYCEYSVS